MELLSKEVMPLVNKKLGFSVDTPLDKSAATGLGASNSIPCGTGAV